MAGLSDLAAIDLFARMFPGLVEWKHPHVPKVSKAAVLHIKTEGQTDKNIQEIVAWMLKESGCGRCGRVARLAMDWVIQPADELSKNGVTEADVVGFGS